MSQFIVPQNIVLISENKLKAFTDIDQNVTSAVLLPFIQVVQQTKLEYIIGSRYYVELLNQVSASTLTTINENFINFYVSPMLIHAAAAEAMPSILFRIKNNGIVAGAENSITLKEMEYLQKKYDDRSQFFEARLIEQIVWNSNLYPLVWQWSSNDGIRPHLGKQYFSGLHIPNNGTATDINRFNFPGMTYYAGPEYACIYGC